MMKEIEETYWNFASDNIYANIVFAFIIQLNLVDFVAVFFFLLFNNFASLCHVIKIQMIEYLFNLFTKYIQQISCDMHFNPNVDSKQRKICINFHVTNMNDE